MMIIIKAKIIMGMTGSIICVHLIQVIIKLSINVYVLMDMK